MMRQILLAVLALIVLRRTAALQVHTPATMLRINTDKENSKISNKSLEFVKIIREDLRRNNDDYAAAMMLERQQGLPRLKLKSAPPRIDSMPYQPHLAPLTPGPPYRGTSNRGPAVQEPPNRGPPIREPPNRGPPVREPPNRGPPIREPPSRGPPIREPPYRGPPVREPPYRGPPLRESPYRGPPARDPPYRGPTVREPPYRGPPVHEPPHRGGPTAGESPYHRPYTHEPPYREPSARGPLSRQSPYRGPPLRAPPVRVPPYRGPSTRDPPSLQIPKYYARRGLNVTINQTTIPPSFDNVTVFRSYSHPPERHFKKVRVDKLKRLIDKGKSRLREMARTNTTPQGGATPNGANGANGPNAANGVNGVKGVNGAKGANGNKETEVNGAKGANGAFGVNGIEWKDIYHSDEHVAQFVTPHRPDWPLQHGVLTRPPPSAATHHGPPSEKALRHHPVHGSPSPDQLDMAPARGPNVQLVRYKGRLCQRSMLHVEGPRYNSLGSTVRPQWNPDLDGPFGVEQTLMILPRCCNCCKKSVLGCQ